MSGEMLMLCGVMGSVFGRLGDGVMVSGVEDSCLLLGRCKLF